MSSKKHKNNIITCSYDYLLLLGHTPGTKSLFYNRDIRQMAEKCSILVETRIFFLPIIRSLFYFRLSGSMNVLILQWCVHKLYSTYSLWCVFLCKTIIFDKIGFLTLLLFKNEWPRWSLLVDIFTKWLY